METNERYMKSPIVTSMDMYDYVKETGIGDVFTIFELKAIEPQTIPELNGEYLYIEKIKEKYTMHTRTVTSTDAKAAFQHGLKHIILGITAAQQKQNQTM